MPGKICPAAVLKIVQLAGSGGLEIPGPGKPLNNDAPRQFGFKQCLRRLKPVQRHAHVHVMRGVFHDVVQKRSYAGPNVRCTVVDTKGLAAAQSLLLSYQATLVWVWWT